jgi:Ca2+:H+ antiporter
VLNWLFVFVPITIALEFLKPDAHALIFIAACVAIIPLAGWLGRATEELAHHTGEGIGGLLNATFGNAAELIIAIMALRKGLYPVVKASLTGSIIGNILLVLGAAVLAGGLKHKEQCFNAVAARSQSTLLTLAAVGLIMPAAFHYLSEGHAQAREGSLSLEISLVLLLAYVAHLLFSLYTHKDLFTGTEQPHSDVQVPSPAKSIASLIAATALIAWISEILVGSVEAAAVSFGMSRIFIGVIVVAIIGNAAEHSTAILFALKNRMELAIGIAIGSSLQMALFVAPVLVILSLFIGPHPMDLVFSPAEVLAIFLAILITGQIASDGQSNWLEGVMLLAVYIIFAAIFYFLPDTAAHPA